VYGGLRFFERAEIKHALAYLRLLENPRDDTSFLRVVNFPPRGIGARTLEALQDAARGLGTSLHDAVSSVPARRRQPGGLRGPAGRAARADRRPHPARDHRADAGGQRPDRALPHEKEGQDRIENLQELVNAAESFVTQEGFGRDAVALPVDEQGTVLTQSPASQGIDPDAPMLDAAIDADTGETQSPGRLPPTPRWRPATTRPRPGRTRCS
jgi:DNA helicase-2/ATP-dependent DNA helicase PcrA